MILLVPIVESVISFFFKTLTQIMSFKLGFRLQNQHCKIIFALGFICRIELLFEVYIVNVYPFHSTLFNLYLWSVCDWKCWCNAVVFNNTLVCLKFKLVSSWLSSWLVQYMSGSMKSELKKISSIDWNLENKYIFIMLRVENISILTVYYIHVAFMMV